MNVQVSGIITERDYVCKIALDGRQSKDTKVLYFPEGHSGSFAHVQVSARTLLILVNPRVVAHLVEFSVLCMKWRVYGLW